MFAIQVEGDGSILADDKLRAILKTFELACDAPESRLNFLPYLKRLAPNLQRQCASGIAGDGVSETFTLSGSLLPCGSNHDHQPQLFGERNFRDWNVTAHFSSGSASRFVSLTPRL